MNRLFYLAGWAWVALSAALLVRGPVITEPAYGPDMVAIFSGSDAYAWFQRVRPSCNAVEVQVRLRGEPPPAGVEGTGFGAACLALAGRVAEARERILELSEAERASAAAIVFGVGHPVADMGDDASAGPIMRLVVEFAPWNYMAQYHAGMSYYALGEMDLARTHLDLFLAGYGVEDGWRANALTILERLEAR